MSPIKRRVIELVKSLPEDCSWEDIQYHLYVREKVEQGMRAVREGHSIPQEQAEAKINGWLKSLGRRRR